jgi:hypothetical protein
MPHYLTTEKISLLVRDGPFNFHNVAEKNILILVEEKKKF